MRISPIKIPCLERSHADIMEPRQGSTGRRRSTLRAKSKCHRRLLSAALVEVTGWSRRRERAAHRPPARPRNKQLAAYWPPVRQRDVGPIARSVTIDPASASWALASPVEPRRGAFLPGPGAIKQVEHPESRSTSHAGRPEAAGQCPLPSQPLPRLIVVDGGMPRDRASGRGYPSVIVHRAQRPRGRTPPCAAMTLSLRLAPNKAAD